MHNCLIWISYKMKIINPKCTNEDSFKYSILISLHYYELNIHKKRINQLNKYTNNHNFESNNYDNFENNNPYISLSVYDENVKLLYKSLNNTNNEASTVKINNHWYHALKRNKNIYKQLNDLLKQFTHKELTECILNKVTH